MLLAQSLGEYGALGSMVARLVAGLDSTAQWVQTSVREERTAWIVAGCVLVALWWAFRRR
jgi:hypothetical protein